MEAMEEDRWNWTGSAPVPSQTALRMLEWIGLGDREGVSRLLEAFASLARVEEASQRASASAEQPGSQAALSARELQVLRLIAAGHTNREIADALVLSVRTVERHINNLYAKIGARGKANATAYAFRHGLT